MFVGLNFIDGEFLPHRSDLMNRTGMFPNSTLAELNESVMASRRAFFRNWKALPRSVRAAHLEDCLTLVYSNFDHLLRCVQYESGRSHDAVHYELSELLKRIEGALSYDDETPASGSTALITSWRSSIVDCGYWHFFHLLVQGNTVIWQPDRSSCASAQMLVDLCAQTHLPPGTFNLLHGDESFSLQMLRAPVESFVITSPNFLRNIGTPNPAHAHSISA